MVAGRAKAKIERSKGVKLNLVKAKRPITMPGRGNGVQPGGKRPGFKPVKPINMPGRLRPGNRSPINKGQKTVKPGSLRRVTKRK